MRNALVGWRADGRPRVFLPSSLLAYALRPTEKLGEGQILLSSGLGLRLASLPPAVLYGRLKASSISYSIILSVEGRPLGPRKRFWL
jgi:hypothetical protein